MKFRLRKHLLGNRSLGMLKLLLCLLLLTVPVLGQTVTGQLKVSVTDATGGIVAGAEVTIKNQSTGQSFTATTSAEGLAVFNDVPLGSYEVVAKVDSFAKAIARDVTVIVGQAQTVELRLSAGGIVTAAALAAVVEEQEDQISALPNINNDLTPLLQVVPGSVATGPSSLGRVIFDGKGNDQITLRLDGVDFTVLTELPAADPAIDALGSFQKPEVAGNLDRASPTKGAFAPILGPGTGGVVDGQTYKSDSSTWKAQIYGELRNDALNARNFFDYDGKNALRRSHFGGKAGRGLGNAKKAFLFFAYDGFRGRTKRNVYEAVPVEASCNCAVGPLAQVVPGFLPPGTQVVQGASLNPDFVVARRRIRVTSRSNAGNLRLDYFPHPDSTNTIKAKDVFTFRYTHQVGENIVPDGVTGRQQRQRVTFANGLASILWASSDETAHLIKFGFNETRAQVDARLVPETSLTLRDSIITTPGTVKTVGLPAQITSVPIATLGGLIKNIGRGFTLTPISYSLGYDLLHLEEKHKLNLGFEARFIRERFDRLGGLTYTFPNAAALRAGTPGTVTFLSDLSGPSPFSSGSGPRHARQQYYLGYLQMVSSVGKPQDDPTNTQEKRSRLIFTYGFRYDYFSPVQERDNRAVVVNPLTGEILPPGTAFYRTEKFNFQPRFGIAYRLDDEGFFRNTVFRGGIGVYCGVPRTGDLLLPIESDRFSTGITGGSFPANPADVIRGFITDPDTRQFQPLAFARDFKVLERVYKWDAQITQTIHGYDLGLLYSGNVGRNLPLAGIANKIVSVTTNPDPTKPAIVVREFDIVRGGLVFQPFGEFFYRTGNGHSSYNGLTIVFGRNTKAEPAPHPSQWLREAVKSLNIQYTFSHNAGNASGTVASSPFDFDSDFGTNAADVRHNFKISAVYDLWRAWSRTKDKPTDLLRGWKIR